MVIPSSNAPSYQCLSGWGKLKLGTSGGIDIRHASQPVVETFDYRQYYMQGVGTLNFL